MNHNLNRRDFFKLGALALGGAAFTPYLKNKPATTVFLPGLTDFDDSFVVRIGTKEMPVRKEPTDKSRIELSWYRDDLVHVYEEVTAEEPAHNPVWYRVWGGYLHRGRLHRVRTIYNKPQDIPADKQRLLTEVTVPFTTPYRYTKLRGWEALTPPLYYGSIHWVEALEEGPEMEGYDGPWYRIFDELDSNVSYHVPAIHMRVMPAEYFEPISPDVPLDDKLIEVNLSTQMLYAYEYGKLVFQTNIASGIQGGGLGGSNGLSTTTPNGKFRILDKVPAKHMGNSYFSVSQSGNLLADEDGYVLPGVPWSSFFTPVGHAFHGTYWHENFGQNMSHGCVNMRSNEANWIFRWVMPEHSPDAISNHRGLGTPVEIHY